MRSWPERRVAARVLGSMFMLGALAGAIVLVLPNSVDRVDMMAFVVAAAGLTGLAIFIAAEGTPAWALLVMTAIGSALINAAAISGGAVTGLYAMLFVWMVIFSAYFFSNRVTVALLAWILAGYSLALAMTRDTAIFPYTWLFVTALVLAVTAAVIAHLVDRRTRAQDELRRYFDLSLDMLCTTDADGRVIDANRAWVETFGDPERESRERTLVDLVAPEDAAATEAALLSLTNGATGIDFESRYHDDDGHLRWLSWRATIEPREGLVYARATDVTERKRVLEEVESEARHDFLTGVANRRGLAEEMSREISRAQRRDAPLSVGVLDLDHFKDFNDRYGHLEGDKLLKEATAAWSAALRETDLLARIGGEEFLVLMPECDLAEAEEAVDRIRLSTPPRVTCSAGVAQWRQGESRDELVHRADLALYEAKTGGRDRVSVSLA